jgi:hypothetical protein
MVARVEILYVNRPAIMARCNKIRMLPTDLLLTPKLDKYECNRWLVTVSLCSELMDDIRVIKLKLPLRNSRLSSSCSSRNQMAGTTQSK